MSPYSPIITSHFTFLYHSTSTLSIDRSCPETTIAYKFRRSVDPPPVQVPLKQPRPKRSRRPRRLRKVVSSSGAARPRSRMTPVPIPLLSCQVEMDLSSAQMETQLNPTIKLRLRNSQAEKIRISVRVHCPLVAYHSLRSRMSTSSVMRCRLVNCGRNWPLWTHMRRLRGTRKEIPGAHRREMALLLNDLCSTMYVVHTHKLVCRKRHSEFIKYPTR